VPRHQSVTEISVRPSKMRFMPGSFQESRNPSPQRHERKGQKPKVTPARMVVTFVV
jgi:hypothetical protein